ncbi:5861_t:CDS:2, partial [Rhizophagus irregularis]
RIEVYYTVDILADGDKGTDHDSDDFDRMIMKAFEEEETRIKKERQNKTSSIVETEAKTAINDLNENTKTQLIDTKVQLNDTETRVAPSKSHKVERMGLELDERDNQKNYAIIIRDKSNKAFHD